MFKQDEIIWKNEILEMARQAGMVVVADKFSLLPFLEAFAKLVEERTAAKECEACANLCETYYDPMYAEYDEAGNELATAIRARAQADRGKA